MGLSAAEKNRRKRERKRREKERRREEEAAAKEEKPKGKEEPELDVEIEYVAEQVLANPTTEKSPGVGVPEGLPPGVGDSENGTAPQDDMQSVLRKFLQRAAVTAVVSDEEPKGLEPSRTGTHSGDEDNPSDEDISDYEDDKKPMSKRKLRELTRPSVANLKRRVTRPDLVEAHDITASDPDFLIQLKSVLGTVPVPRHWGRKRKYLQGKRGFEKPPFQLPDFIIKTGIAEIRDTVAEDEAKQSAKQKNRSRVNPKMGAMDVDYKTLYEAFFKFQTKPSGLTSFGDLYYEGKELETSTDRKPGGPFSKAFREALGMIGEHAPPPWLINMQRYGPPPSYPNLSIPGLNAPLPNDQCQYGYHTGGWGKPPVDPYGRPLYGGNPFDPPGSGTKEDSSANLVTSDGKTVSKSPWGMPAGHFVGNDEEESAEESSSSDEESSDDDMEESEEEGVPDGVESVLPPPPAAAKTAPGNLRKEQAGHETPVANSLYKVLEQSQDTNHLQGGVFQSDVKYVIPDAANPASADGAASVLSKAIPPSETAKRRRKSTEDDEEDLGNFKF